MIFKNKNMKVLETHFEGHVFRSRLEARYAVFLNELGWSWDYEPESFVFDGGIPYLPDFYLPQLNAWLEVKGVSFTDQEKKKCRLLSEMFPDIVVLMASGLPSTSMFDSYFNGGDMRATISTYIRAKGWSSPYMCGDWWEGDMNAFEAVKAARFEFGIKGIYKTQ